MAHQQQSTNHSDNKPLDLSAANNRPMGSFFRPWELSSLSKSPEPAAAAAPAKFNSPAAKLANVPAEQKSPAYTLQPLLPSMISTPRSTVLPGSSPAPSATRPTCTPSPNDSAYGSNTSSISPVSSGSQSSPGSQTSPVCSTHSPNFRSLDLWYMEHADMPYPSNKETKELSRQSGLNFHQVRKWMSKKRSMNNIGVNPTGPSKVAHVAAPVTDSRKLKSAGAVMQKVKSHHAASPYAKPHGLPAAAVMAPSPLQLQQAQHFYMFQEQQAMQAIYLQQLMAAQTLPLQAFSVPK